MHDMDVDMCVLGVHEHGWTYGLACKCEHPSTCVWMWAWDWGCMSMVGGFTGVHESTSMWAHVYVICMNVYTCVYIFRLASYPLYHLSAKPYLHSILLCFIILN
jgi:hypothetical protein